MEHGGGTSLPKYPRSVTHSASFNTTRVPLTALSLASSGAADTSSLRTFTGEAAEERFHTLVRQHKGPLPGLWFVHGHRHREEWLHHAGMLALSNIEPLVSRSHVLLFSTDITSPTASLLRAMEHYPQRARLLVHTGVNTGYRCGLLHSLATSRHVWKWYGTVIFTHPDVYLLPPAPQTLGTTLSSHARAAFLASFTRMFWHGRSRPGAYLSDLFCFRPALIGHSTAARERRSYWSHASDECTSSLSPDRPGQKRLFKPEQALFEVRSTLNVSYAELELTRSTGWMKYTPSNSGVWHTHNVTQVAAALARLQRGQQNK